MMNRILGMYVAAAVKSSSLDVIKEFNRRQIESELSNWFANARDRGSGGRKAARNISDNTSIDVDTFNL